ncbi:MAG: hypothetical protein ACODAD_14010 [Planctomycetota bacterium]
MLKASGRPAAPRQSIRVRDSEGEISIDTGPVTFTIKKDQPFSLFSSVVAEGKSLVTGGSVTYKQLHGRAGWDDDSAWQERAFTAGAPTEVKVHYGGPVRVTVEVSGPFVNDPFGATYQAWITAHAGRPQVRVKYKIRNSHSEQYTLIPVSDSRITLRLANAVAKTTLGANEPIEVKGKRAWLHQGLLLHDTYQDIPGAAKAGTGDKVMFTGNSPADRPGGWIAAHGNGAVFVCDRLFSTNPARRLEVAGDRLILQGIAQRFDGPRDRKFNRDRIVGQPWQSKAFWLYDCSHHSSEYLIDFAPPSDPQAMGDAALAFDRRLHLCAPPSHYSRCNVHGTGHFGTLADEMQAYEKWGWTFEEDDLPRTPSPPRGAFVAWEDNHYESEADSVEGLLLMYMRTGDRGWFDLAEAWARYHMDLQTWRTDRWCWKDGGIWFPQGGPQGNRRVRKEWNFSWGPDYGERKDSPACADIWKQARGKSCYCHFYGGGLADYYCLTGDPDALTAAIDNVEQKDDEFRHFKQFEPGETAIRSIRGFGRGFDVIMRVLKSDPKNQYIVDLAHLCAATLWESPVLDERGFHPAAGQGLEANDIPEEMKAWMETRGISLVTERGRVTALKKDGRQWPVISFGGTWQHYYVQNAADQYARYFDDENIQDFTIAMAHMAANYLLSDKCHQTPYYTYFDIPDYGLVYDPWIFSHQDTKDGEGCVHSGYYTRFFPDVCVKGYSWTGDRELLRRGREFWYYGSKRTYRSERLKGGPNEVYQFATHKPPKNDSVLETGRLFYEATHTPADVEAPTAIDDLTVKRVGDGKAELAFTAPKDRKNQDGKGAVVRYQVKVASLPMVAYEDWDPARDRGKKRNWWRATNCQGEPAPGQPGNQDRFLVRGVPTGKGPWYFAIRSFDAAGCRSQISNVAVAKADAASR